MATTNRSMLGIVLMLTLAPMVSMALGAGWLVLTGDAPLALTCVSP
jgi:hypothetical protein